MKNFKQITMWVCAKKKKEQLRAKCKTYNQLCKYQIVYTKDTPQTLYFIITPKTQVNVYKTFHDGYDMHNTTQIDRKSVV